MRVLHTSIERESTLLYTCCQEIQEPWLSAPRLGAKLCHGCEILSTKLADAAPQQGIEIRRSSNKAYRPLTCLILDPNISVRKLNVGESFAKFWLSSNWNKIGAIVSRYQQIFPPRRDTCLALTEFITGSWTSVYDDGSTESLSFFPIVLGYA